MHAVQLVAGVIDIDHQPIQEWEYFVEPCITVQIGIIEAHIAAVAKADVERHQRQTWLSLLRHAVAIGVEEHATVQIGAPLCHGNFKRLRNASDDIAIHLDRRRQAVDQQVVPLVEDGDFHVALGDTGERKCSIGVALGERKIVAVRCAQADVALRKAVDIVAAAAVDPLIGRTAQTCARNHSVYSGATRSGVK